MHSITLVHVPGEHERDVRRSDRDLLAVLGVWLLLVK